MRIRVARLLSPTLLSLLLLMATASPVWAAEPVTLQLQAPAQVSLGDKVAVTAVLQDGKGAPVPGATIVLWSSGSFLSVAGAVQLGQAVTDAQGRVTFTYEARTDGAVTLNAFFAGNSRYSPTQASAEIQVTGSAQLSRHPIEGVRVPGIGVWILAGILGGVWGTYLVVMVLLTLIAREAPKSSPEAGGRRG